MANEVPPTPKGVIAYLTVKGGIDALAFYDKAFGAVETYRMMADDGKRVLNAQLDINGGVIMLSDDFPEYTGGVSGAPDASVPRGIVLHMQVDDCDAAFARAVEAGAVAKMALADMFWGDRYAQITDPFGHVWSLAHTLKK